jgi:succinate dehydrogenase flavin-adding protein (antitoxin of CptAB toxin-antitoxin module)
MNQKLSNLKKADLLSDILYQREFNNLPKTTKQRLARILSTDDRALVEHMLDNCEVKNN